MTMTSNWIWTGDVKMYGVELKNPLPADTSCALFRKELDTEPISFPVKKAER